MLFRIAKILLFFGRFYLLKSTENRGVEYSEFKESNSSKLPKSSKYLITLLTPNSKLYLYLLVGSNSI